LKLPKLLPEDWPQELPETRKRLLAMWLFEMEKGLVEEETLNFE
jgi:hypothetical protein